MNGLDKIVAIDVNPVPVDLFILEVEFSVQTLACKQEKKTTFKLFWDVHRL